MSEKPEHGIAGAYYSSDGQCYRPVLECSCGFSNSRGTSSWAEAGEELDDHLSATTQAATAGGE